MNCSRTQSILKWPSYFGLWRHVSKIPINRIGIGQLIIIIYIVLLGALCSTPLGLQNGRLRNNKITASSEYNGYHAARLGRLGKQKKGRYVGAWCAKHNNKNQWLKVDFGRPTKITKIATQGRQDSAQWVTYYQVSSSLDGIHWQVYRFKNSDKVNKLDSCKILWRIVTVQACTYLTVNHYSICKGIM